MFKTSPASLQTFSDTPNCVLEDRVQYSTVRVQYSTVRVHYSTVRVQYSMVHIPNMFCYGHLQIINCVQIVCVFFFCMLESSGVQRLFNHPV
jgi:hypothetical protein